MPSFVWDGDEWVDIATLPPRPKPKGPAIISDHHDPFKSMADGKVYDSKSAYRRSLRERGLVELGNEMPQERAFEPRSVKEDIKTAIEQVKAGKGASAIPRADLDKSISTGKTPV